MTLTKNVTMLAALVANIGDVPLISKVFHLRLDGWAGDYLSPVPQAVPQAAGFSSLSPEPQAVPHAAGFSSLSPEPQAVPQAAGVSTSALRMRCALWLKPNSLERFILFGI
jgi:hypothetical protein